MVDSVVVVNGEVVDDVKVVDEEEDTVVVGNDVAVVVDEGDDLVVIFDEYLTRLGFPVDRNFVGMLMMF